MTKFEQQQTTFTDALIQIRDAYTKGNDKNVHEAIENTSTKLGIYTPSCKSSDMSIYE